MVPLPEYTLTQGQEIEFKKEKEIQVPDGSLLF